MNSDKKVDVAVDYVFALNEVEVPVDEGQNGLSVNAEVVDKGPSI